jgi:hypothetical protein
MEGTTSLPALLQLCSVALCESAASGDSALPSRARATLRLPRQPVDEIQRALDQQLPRFGPTGKKLDRVVELEDEGIGERPRCRARATSINTSI